ncbi:methionyl-tRNA formyltransferase [Firmicutes bacterium CAG:534]|nr:methionyl-tRNA formyltransferase [Firmicutes bacterium CAG:534]
MIRIVYMGTPDFAVEPLEAIIKAGYEVAAVVTQPDKQKGRGKEVKMTPVKECALRHGIPVFQPVKIKEPEAVAELEKYQADLFVVAAFGQLLSEEILNMPEYGCINIHASLLPAYRGAAPIQWAVLNGEKESGVTIMQMDKGLDTGDMLLKRSVELSPKETGDSLHDKLMHLGAELIVEALPKLEKGELVPEKQKDELSSYAKKLTKAMGQIDWSKDAVSLERWIRGLNSWPSAYTFFGGKTLKIWEARVAEENGAQKAEPGQVVSVSREGFTVACGQGALQILSLQLEGKKRVLTREFLLGYQVEPGMILG